MSWEFRSGMKVVCIGRQWESFIGEPEKGKVYVVTDVNIFPKGSICDDKDFRPFVLLVDVVSVRIEGYGGIWFHAGAFKPVDETRLDQFRAHLNPITREVEPA